jgi:predicted nuclease with RNAse H fold
MILRCIDLKATLEAAGHQVFEVYPFAAKVILFGRPIPKKTTPEGLTWYRDRIAEVCGPAPAIGAAGHDELDAALVAAVVRWRRMGLSEEVGDPAEGTILVPKGRLPDDASRSGRKAGSVVSKPGEGLALHCD